MEWISTLPQLVEGSPILFVGVALGWFGNAYFGMRRSLSAERESYQMAHDTDQKTISKLQSRISELERLINNQDDIIEEFRARIETLEDDRLHHER